MIAVFEDWKATALTTQPLLLDSPQQKLEKICQLTPKNYISWSLNQEQKRLHPPA